MTVVYTHEVSTGSRGFGNFVKLLFRWRGSIYKLVLPDLFLYTFFYYSINFVYRFYLIDLPEENPYRHRFHQMIDYCDDVSAIIPLQFVLGFYVSQIVTRWWSQFMTIPWPDTLSIVAATAVQGHDERGRMMRRTMLRYVNLSLIFVFCMISTQARSRFPSMEHMVEAGFLLPHEKIIIDHLIEKLPGPKYYVPLVWCGAIGAKARKEGRIRDDISAYHLIKEICKFRGMLGDLLNYDWVCIPIVYTQVVTLAVYIYFLACLIGKQLIQRDDKIDLYVPIFHLLEFFFMMGWLKVAETLINPFGEDDDDFEVNWLIDRNVRVSYMIVDEMNTEFPELVKDQYWDNVVPEELYYTETALKYKNTEGGYRGSAVAAMEPPPGYDGESKSRKGEGSVFHSMAGGSGAIFSMAPHHQERRNTLVMKESKVKQESLGQLFDRTYIPAPDESNRDFNTAKDGR